MACRAQRPLFSLFLLACTVACLSFFRLTHDLSTIFPLKGLIGESEDVSHFPLQSEYAKMEKNFKVFVYPPEYMYENCNGTMNFNKQYYATELQFYKNIRDSRFVTENPVLADMYFIPFGCHKEHNKTTSFDCQASDDTLLASFKRLKNKYIYWNGTSGADHFWVTCQDIGEIHLKILSELSSLTNNSIRVFSYSNPIIQYGPTMNATLPEMALPFAGSSKRRDKLSFWPSPALIDTRGNNYRRKYRRYLYRSKYCVCDTRYESRHFGAILADAIHYGCVPVVLYDLHDLPFDGILNWMAFAVLLREKSVDYTNRTVILDVLNGISDASYRTLQRNIVKVRKCLQWNSPPVRFDAFHMTMYDLWKRSGWTEF